MAENKPDEKYIPDTSASKPKPGQPTVQTDQGVLDKHDVTFVKVGGQGVVHIHKAGPPAPPEGKS